MTTSERMRRPLSNTTCTVTRNALPAPPMREVCAGPAATTGLAHSAAPPRAAASTSCSRSGVHAGQRGEHLRGGIEDVDLRPAPLYTVTYGSARSITSRAARSPATARRHGERRAARRIVHAGGAIGGGFVVLTLGRRRAPADDPVRVDVGVARSAPSEANNPASRSFGAVLRSMRAVSELNSRRHGGTADAKREAAVRRRAAADRGRSGDAVSSTRRRPAPPPARDPCAPRTRSRYRRQRSR